MALGEHHFLQPIPRFGSSFARRSQSDGLGTITLRTRYTMANKQGMLDQVEMVLNFLMLCKSPIYITRLGLYHSGDITDISVLYSSPSSITPLTLNSPSVMPLEPLILQLAILAPNSQSQNKEGCVVCSVMPDHHFFFRGLFAPNLVIRLESLPFYMFVFLLIFFLSHACPFLSYIPGPLVVVNS